MIILFIEDNMKEEISAFLLSDLVYQNFYYLVTIYKAIETNSDHHKLLQFASEDLPFIFYLIIFIYVLHNFLIDMCNFVQDADILLLEVTEQLQ